MEAAISADRTVPHPTANPAGIESPFITAQRDFSDNDVLNNDILKCTKTVLENGTAQEKEVIFKRLEVEIHNPKLSVDFRNDLTKVRDDFSDTTPGSRAQIGWDLESAKVYLSQFSFIEEQTRCYSEAQKPFLHDENANNLIRKNMEAVLKNGTPTQKEIIFNRLKSDIANSRLPPDLKADLVNIRDTFLGLDELKINISKWAKNDQIKLIDALDYAWGGGWNQDRFGISACKKNALANFPQTPESRKSATIAFNNIVQNTLTDQLSAEDKKSFNKCLSGKPAYDDQKNAAQNWCSTKRQDLYRSKHKPENEEEKCTMM